jgi:hypothetical protein
VTAARNSRAIGANRVGSSAAIFLNAVRSVSTINCMSSVGTSLGFSPSGSDSNVGPFGAPGFFRLDEARPASV